MPLPAGAAAFVGVAVAYAVAAAKVSKVNGSDIMCATILVLGLLFGAYGNTLRERHLAARGFLLRDTTLRIHPVYGPLASGLRAMWTNKRLRAVSAGTILVVSVATGLYFLLRPSAYDRLAKLTEVKLVGHCIGR